MKKNSSAKFVVVILLVLGVIGVLLATQLNDRIESSAKKTYVFTTYLKHDNIKIKTSDDSVVTLTGTVSQWSHRALAKEAVAGLPGVKKVNDNLEFKGAQPAENSDGWIAIKVKTMLMFHRNLSFLKTDVEVKNGTAILGGKATSEAQKELTTEYVRDVDGVTKVVNNMTIEKEGKNPIETVSDFMDDASIIAQVKLALLSHRSTNAIKTVVESKDGVVTLKGVAKNSAEKDLVNKLVNDIKGVKSVKNEMTIG